MNEKLKAVRLFLLDMDGTLYLGGKLIEGAVDFIEQLRENGVGYVFLTNNSSRAQSDYVKKMQALGFVCGEENVFTSGMAAGQYLRRNFPGQRVYLVGTRALRREIEGYGVTLTEERPDIVLAGFDTELDYRKLELATNFLKDGARFIATHPDWVCPMEGGAILPDCGSICALLTAATGREPEYIGKPNRRMIDLMSEARGIPNENIAMVGDRLYTDIAVAVNAGAVSVCVLSGETSPEMLARSEWKPDYTFPSVKELAAALRD